MGGGSVTMVIVYSINYITKQTKKQIYESKEKSYSVANVKDIYGSTITSALALILITIIIYFLLNKYYHLALSTSDINYPH